MRESSRETLLSARVIGDGADPARLTFGEAETDAWLRGGLLRDGVHEFYAADSSDGCVAAAVALLLGLRRCAKDGTMLWLREKRAGRALGQLYAPGLAAFGGNPDAVIPIQLPDLAGLLRAAADSVRHGAAPVVAMEVAGAAPALDLTASRRLALAAARSGVMVLIARSGAEPSPSVAHTRWRVTAAPSVPLEANAPGAPAFDLTLLRQRGGREGLEIRLEWDRDRRCFRTPLSGGGAALAAGGAERDVRRRAA